MSEDREAGGDTAKVTRIFSSGPGDIAPGLPKEFEWMFLRRLTGDVAGLGYPHLAEAILKSGRAVGAGIPVEPEFDSLVDLALTVRQRAEEPGD